MSDFGACKFCAHPLTAADIHIEYGPFHRADGRKITAKHEVVKCPKSKHKYHREIARQMP